MIDIDKIKEYATENNVPIMLNDGIDYLCEYIKENSIKSILECGTAIGYSSIKMAMLEDDIFIDTCEINQDSIEIALKNIELASLSDRIKVYHCDAAVYETDKIYDLIFVDAAKAQYRKYMEHFLGNIAENGVFVFDNLNFHGMVDHPELTKSRNTKSLLKKIRIFRDYICQSDQFETQYFESIGDGIAFVKIKKGDNQ